jgi:hypothetical protein
MVEVHEQRARPEEVDYTYSCPNPGKWWWKKLFESTGREGIVTVDFTVEVVSPDPVVISTVIEPFIDIFVRFSIIFEAMLVVVV